jgi:UDP-N-acetylglucosamine 2-epimerase (non-hydrolysing)
MENRKKLLFIVGTRPEAIKTIPVFFEAKKYNNFDSRLLVSGQHKELMDSVLEDFEVKADYTLVDSNDKHGLLNTLTRLTVEIEHIIIDFLPDLVFVHGDTLTAYVASLVCFFKRIPIAHIESGLRTNDVYSPYPEEFFRVSIDRVSTLYYCPTIENLRNLHKEGIGTSAIVTGNTGIDALHYMISNSKLTQTIQDRPIVLITAHRRESFGLPLNNVFSAINQLAKTYPEFDFFIPLHPNPIVKESANVLDNDLKNIIVTSPQSYKQFSQLMSQSFIIMTDSGGIQEEAVFLGKPLIILRDKTERPEVISSNHAILAGTNKEIIINSFKSIVINDLLRKSMTKSSQVFGNGFASKIIMESVSDYLNNLGKEIE